MEKQWASLGLEFPTPSPSTPTNDPSRIWKHGPYRFRADFDSGNLAKVTPTTAEFKEFDLWIRPDCAGQPCETNHRTWFYFGVSGFNTGQTLRFNVVNMNKQAKLFSFDMRPVYFVPGVSAEWEVLQNSVRYQHSKGGFRISFNHKFLSAEETFFAFCIPFSYTDNQTLMDNVEQHAMAREDLYFCRETLGTSKCGRTLDLLTVSSRHGMMDKTEPARDLSYPCVNQGEKGAAAFDNSKKVFVVSSRVHPGETPASHVFNGMLAFLLQPNDPRAQILRENFVFKLVPMINPDGVSLGHYRCDSLGQNLNRYYSDPSIETHAEVFALKALLAYYHRKGTLEATIDLHAHANRMGTFAYGNAIPDQEEQLQSIMYTKLVSMNTPSFDFRSCCFSQKNMSNKDKNGESKEGSNRVATYRMTGLVHVYTIESNYACASLTTAVKSAENGDRTVSPPYRIHSKAKYTQKSFGHVGKALLVGMLDVKGLNPYTRLKSSEFKNMHTLRNWACSYWNAGSSKRASLLLQRTAATSCLVAKVAATTLASTEVAGEE